MSFEINKPDQRTFCHDQKDNYLLRVILEKVEMTKLSTKYRNI